MFLTKQTTGVGALAFRFIFWLWRRWAYMGQFNAQDQWMIESMQIPPERLYRPDSSITAWRRLVEDEARGAGAGVRARTPGEPGGIDAGAPDDTGAGMPDGMGARVPGEEAKEADGTGRAEAATG
jgi:hypothetical protein